MHQTIYIENIGVFSANSVVEHYTRSICIRDNVIFTKTVCRPELCVYVGQSFPWSGYVDRKNSWPYNIHELCNWVEYTAKTIFIRRSYIHGTTMNTSANTQLPFFNTHAAKRYKKTLKYIYLHTSSFLCTKL